tara:strand:+ start:1483 stop:1887 length:405 start_codon:yes stop_codon:yes gene_type:complete
MAEIIGNILAGLILFGWIPFAGYTVGTEIRNVGGIAKNRMFPPKTVKKTPKTPRVVSVEQAMSRLKVSKDELIELIRNETITTYNKNGEVVLDSSDVTRAKKPSKTSSKSKRDYPVIETYDDRYKISNPVEFTT